MYRFSLVLKVVFTESGGSPRPFQGIHRQKSFPNNTTVLLAIFALLIFVLMMQEQRWVRLLAPKWEWRCGSQLYQQSLHCLCHDACTGKRERKKERNKMKEGERKERIVSLRNFLNQAVKLLILLTFSL